MRKRIGILAVALVLGCGGGQPASTTETAQGAAKLWLQAALDRNGARLQELSADDFKERCENLAEQVREKFEAGTEVRWGASGQEGGEYGWTATAPGGVLFFKVRQVGAEHRVSDLSTSW